MTFEINAEAADGLDRPLGAVVQAAVDATAAAYARDAGTDVDAHLRAQLTEAGVASVDDRWLAAAARGIRSGHPVRIDRPDTWVTPG